ncbi:MAG: cobalt transporter [Clostridia bacterium]|nr:cobalt transporter [Clostridia bacterium]
MHDGHDHAAGQTPREPDRQETLALMQYMLQHNEHHAAELSTLADRLEALGEARAASQLRLAQADYDKGNIRLEATLFSLKN